MGSKSCEICRQGKYDHTYDYPILESQLRKSRAKCDWCAILASAVEVFRPLRSSSEATVSILRRASEYGGRDNYYLEVETSGAQHEVAEIFTKRSTSPWPALHRRRLVSEHALSKRCTDLASSWIRTCMETHSQCRPTKLDDWMPTRLIDVGSSHVDPRLCIMAGSAFTSSTSTSTSEPTPQYVVLSHSWGKRQPLRLLSSNLAAFQQAIPFRDLPLTFQHVVEVVRRLGFRYLWIDSLCIMQDSPSDWRYESVRMRQVYEQAVFALYADAGPDSASGLGAEAGRAAWMQKRLAPGIYVRRVYDWTLFVEAPVSRDVPPHCPGRDELTWLGQRGWTYQERMIPRRRLYFGANEMAWECQSRGACECAGKDSEEPGQRYEGADGIFRFWASVRGAGEVDGNHSDATSFCELWCTIVCGFTSRALTFDADLLPALSGMAAVAAPRLGLTYLAGLWAEHLDTMLLWQVSHGGRGARHAAYYAPSWTWASRVGRDLGGMYRSVQVSYFLVPGSVPALGFSIRRVMCTYPDDNPLLPPLDGFLDVEAFVVELDYTDVSHWPRLAGVITNYDQLRPDVYTPDKGGTASASGAGSWNAPLDIDPNRTWASGGFPEMYPGRPYWFVVMRQRPHASMTQLQGIVVCSSTRVAGAYERVGHYECMQQDASAWVKSFTKKSLRIV